MEGEYFFTRQQTSASLAFHATRKYNFFGWNEFNGMAVEGQFRKYLSYITVSKQDQFKQYHQGIFIGAFLKSGKYSDSLEDRPWVVDTGEKFMVFFPGMLAGVQWILWDRIAVEMYTGAGLRQVIDAQEGRLSNRGETETLSFYYKGVMPKMGISLGLPF
ncbi:MAG: hypothetical protein OEX02_16275 [Cyclobacteriaceae bacterium]|nr:hypothetical protein [Cyclobacteriaceae bacterium]